MIQVVVERDGKGRIVSVQVDGHAGYAEAGRDIVCAAVSAISIGMVNAVETVLGVQLPTEVKDDGFLRCRMPSMADGETRDKVQLLLEAMVAALRSVEAEYGRYMRVTER